VKAEIICQYRQNPRLVDSPVGLAQKIGVPVASIKTGLKGLELLGILVRTQVGTSEMFALNEARDKEIQTMLAQHLAMSKADQSRTHLSDENMKSAMKWQSLTRFSPSNATMAHRNLRGILQ
jgi:hypothetical protein